MKINYVALIKLILLDLILIGIAIGWVALVFSAWCASLSFLLSPLLLLIVNVSGLQAFSMLNLAVALILSALSYFWILPFAKSFNRYTQKVFTHVIQQQKNEILGVKD